MPLLSYFYPDVLVLTASFPVYIVHACYVHVAFRFGLRPSRVWAEQAPLSDTHPLDSRLQHSNIMTLTMRGKPRYTYVSVSKIFPVDRDGEDIVRI